MKKRFYFLATVFFATVQLMAQVGINADSSQPHPSAGLDVKFSNKGFLPPRMTNSELNAIANPADGLIVYCTNCGQNGAGALAMFTNGAWFTLFANCLNPLSPGAGVQIVSNMQIEWNWIAVLNATGYKWNDVNDYASAANIGINTSFLESELSCMTPYTRYVWAYNACGQSPATILSGTTTGIVVNPPVPGTHIPSMNQIVWKWNSVAGATGYKWSASNNFSTAIDMGTSLLIAETGLTCNTAYTRFVWAYNNCGSSVVTTLNQATLSSLINSPTAGTSVSSPTQIVWNWNSVIGATGYKWNTVDDYATATDMGMAVTKTETGLICSTPYQRFVWAYNACASSIPVTLTQSTSVCWICGNSITDIRDSKTYNTVLIGAQCWMAQNLNVGIKIDGIISQTDNGIIEKYCYDNSESNCTIHGGLYWWGEFMNYSSSSSNNPSGRQGICPTGWHIPSDNEWCQMEVYLDPTVDCSLVNYSGTDAGGKMKATGTSLWASPNTGATNSSGFTGIPGGFMTNGNQFVYIAEYADFWSATQSSSPNAWYHNLKFNTAQVYRNEYDKTYGFSGRCVKD